MLQSFAATMTKKGTSNASKKRIPGGCDSREDSKWKDGEVETDVENVQGREGQAGKWK